MPVRRTPITYTSAAGVVQLEGEDASRRPRTSELRDVPMYAAVAPRSRTTPEDREDELAEPRSLGRRLDLDDGHRAAGRSGDLVDLRVRERAAVEQRAAVAHEGDHGRIAESQRLRERLLDGARGARQLRERKRAAPDARDGLLDLAADESRKPLRARPHALEPARAASAGPERRRACAGSSASCSVPSSAASVSLSARSARWSGCRRSRSTRSARPTTMPACGPPRSLSPEKQTRSAPARRLSAGVGSSADASERTRAEVVDERELVRRSRSRRALPSSRTLGEPDDAEVRLVHAQEDGGLRPDRPLVVGGACAVRRPDLDESRARAREHVGDPEAVADLDQLAARDDDLAPLRERREREQHGRCVVVDDERGVGPGQAAEQVRRDDPAATRAPRARGRTRGSSSPPPTSATRASAASASGARPRFVWTSTPVAFRTRRSDGRRACASSAATRRRAARDRHPP